MASLGHIVRRLCPTCLELPRLQGSTCQPVPGLVGLRQLVQTPMARQTNLAGELATSHSPGDPTNLPAQCPAARRARRMRRSSPGGPWRSQTRHRSNGPSPYSCPPECRAGAAQRNCGVQCSPRDAALLKARWQVWHLRAACIASYRLQCSLRTAPGRTPWRHGGPSATSAEHVAPPSLVGEVLVGGGSTGSTAEGVCPRGTSACTHLVYISQVLGQHGGTGQPEHKPHAVDDEGDEAAGKALAQQLRVGRAWAGKRVC